LRLKILKKLRTASHNSEFTGFNKKKCRVSTEELHLFDACCTQSNIARLNYFMQASRWLRSDCEVFESASTWKRTKSKITFYM